MVLGTSHLNVLLNGSNIINSVLASLTLCGESELSPQLFSTHWVHSTVSVDPNIKCRVWMETMAMSCYHGGDSSPHSPLHWVKLLYTLAEPQCFGLLASVEKLYYITS